MNFQGFLDYNPIIESSVKGAQFGYALACGDLDHDDFSGIHKLFIKVILLLLLNPNVNFN